MAFLRRTRVGVSDDDFFCFLRTRKREGGRCVQTGVKIIDGEKRVLKRWVAQRRKPALRY